MELLTQKDKFDPQKNLKRFDTLRQACCHPSVIRSGKITGIATMDEVMEAMITQITDRQTKSEREFCKSANYLSEWLFYQITKSKRRPGEGRSRS